MGLLPFGRVIKTHGLSGEVKILPFSREFENLSRVKRLFIQIKQDEDPREFNIVRRSFKKGSGILELEGVNSAGAAESLRGCLVLIETSDLSETDEDEYYWFQLIGLSVYTTDGEYIGKVVNLIDREPQSLLIVRDREREHLIPMIDTIIKQINLENSQIVISPIEGLLD
jgi:16S rRNA processing protein RimM